MTRRESRVMLVVISTLSLPTFDLSDWLFKMKESFKATC